MMRLRRGLMKSEHGATAVEFALVFPLFLAFVLAIMDVSIYYFVAGQLQHGTVQAARAIRTGNLVGNTATDRDNFRALVCSHIKINLVGSCTTNVKVDVRSFTAFANIVLPANIAAYDANGNGVIEDAETTFNTGGSSCPVVVRTFYNYTTIIPWLSQVFAGVIPHSSYLTSATAFRNEPHGLGASAVCSDF